jgi:hypothetical protein
MVQDLGHETQALEIRRRDRASARAMVVACFVLTIATGALLVVFAPLLAGVITADAGSARNVFGSFVLAFAIPMAFFFLIGIWGLVHYRRKAQRLENQIKASEAVLGVGR